jgi:hypothetical protein
MFEDKRHRRAVHLPMRGIRTYEPECAMSVLLELCQMDGR